MLIMFPFPMTEYKLICCICVFVRYNVIDLITKTGNGKGCTMVVLTSAEIPQQVHVGILLRGPS